MAKADKYLEEERSFLFSSPASPNGVEVRINPCGEGRCSIVGCVVGSQGVFRNTFADCKFSIRSDVEKAVRQYVAERKLPAVSIVQETYRVFVVPDNGHPSFWMVIKGIPGQGQVQVYATTPTKGPEYSGVYSSIDIKDRRRLLALSKSMDILLFGA